jgi:hypothetical protein
VQIFTATATDIAGTSVLSNAVDPVVRATAIPTTNNLIAGSDQIDLRDINFKSVRDSYANGELTVTDGTHTAELNFNGSYTLANVKFASDGSGGTIVYDPPVPSTNGSSTSITAGSVTIGADATLKVPWHRA